MSKKLTKKQKGFVKDYVETGNGTQAALKNYDTEDENTAAAIASENLTKPKIEQAVTEALSDTLLNDSHVKLFKQKQLAYFTFPKNMEDEEIKNHVEANGLQLIVIRPSDKGKLAFYSIDDAQAISKALDMGYKIKGKYAPEEKSVTVKVEKLGEIQEATKKILE